MSRLSVFNFITLNGFYKGTHEDISWHVHGAEENEYAIGAMDAGNILLFGRVTYEMMAGYWTTPEAMKEAPEVAKGMNESEKIVFSTTLKEAGWRNATLIKKNIVEEVKRLKQSSGKNMTILGSGSIVTLFAEHGLIDDYEIMIDPIALGKGTPIFNNIKHPLNLTLKATRAFKSGVVLLSYRKI